MGGFSIGTSAAPIGTLNFQSGTLRNVADINGGAAMIKTTTGTLTLAGVNSYTGATTVVGGVLRLTGGAAINDSATLNVSSGAKISVVNNETIGQLYLGGVQKPGSTYGSSASNAAHKDDVYFDATQSGVVTVRFPPPPGTAVLFF